MEKEEDEREHDHTHHISEDPYLELGFAIN